MWYDPSYWHEGLRVPFRLSLQLRQLVKYFTEVHTVQAIFVGLLAAIAGLCLFSSTIWRMIRHGGMQTTVLLLWPLGVCLSYYSLLLEYRFIVAYFVLGVIGFAGIGLPALSRKHKMVTLLAFTALLAVQATAGRLLPIARRALHPQTNLERARASDKDDLPTNQAVAAALSRLGIGPGDELGQIGRAIDNVYYARLLGARVIAQLREDPDQVRDLSEPEVQRVLAQFRSVGVKAQVSRFEPGFNNDSGWVAVPETDSYVRLL